MGNLCSVCRRTDGADELEVIGVPETNFDRCSEITPSETTRSTVRQRVRKTPRAKKVHLSHHFEEGVVIPGEWKREDVPLKDRWWLSPTPNFNIGSFGVGPEVLPPSEAVSRVLAPSNPAEFYMAEGDSSSFEEPNFLESEMSEEQDHSDEEDPIYDPGELDSRGSRRRREVSVRDFGFSSKVREVSDVNKMLQPRKSERDISKLVKPKEETAFTSFVQKVPSAFRYGFDSEDTTDELIAPPSDFRLSPRKQPRSLEALVVDKTTQSKFLFDLAQVQQVAVPVVPCTYFYRVRLLIYKVETTKKQPFQLEEVGQPSICASEITPKSIPPSTTPTIDLSTLIQNAKKLEVTDFLQREEDSDFKMKRIQQPSIRIPDTSELRVKKAEASSNPLDFDPDTERSTKTRIGTEFSVALVQQPSIHIPDLSEVTSNSRRHSLGTYDFDPVESSKNKIPLEFSVSLVQQPSLNICSPVINYEPQNNSEFVLPRNKEIDFDLTKVCQVESEISYVSVLSYRSLNFTPKDVEKQDIGDGEYDEYESSALKLWDLFEESSAPEHEQKLSQSQSRKSRQDTAHTAQNPEQPKKPKQDVAKDEYDGGYDFWEGTNKAIASYNQRKQKQYHEIQGMLQEGQSEQRESRLSPSASVYMDIFGFYNGSVASNSYTTTPHGHNSYSSNYNKSLSGSSGESCDQMFYLFEEPTQEEIEARAQKKEERRLRKEEKKRRSSWEWEERNREKNRKEEEERFKKASMEEEEKRRQKEEDDLKRLLEERRRLEEEGRKKEEQKRKREQELREEEEKLREEERLREEESRRKDEAERFRVEAERLKLEEIRRQAEAKSDEANRIMVEKTEKRRIAEAKKSRRLEKFSKKFYWEYLPQYSQDRLLWGSDEEASEYGKDYYYYGSRDFSLRFDKRYFQYILPIVKDARAIPGIEKFKLEERGYMEAVVMICADIKPAKKALELLDPIFENNHQEVIEDYSEFVFGFTVEDKTRIETESGTKLSVVKLENLNKETNQAEAEMKKRYSYYKREPYSVGLAKNTVKKPTLGAKNQTQGTVREQKKVIVIAGKKASIPKVKELLYNVFSKSVKMDSLSKFSVDNIGAKKSEIRKRTSCKITIHRLWGDHNTVILKGLKDQVADAKKMVDSLLKNCKSTSINLKNDRGCKAVIGIQGKNIKFLREKSSCTRIFIDLENFLHLIGTEEQINCGTKLVMRLLRANQHIIGEVF